MTGLRCLVRISKRPINPQSVLSSVRSPDAGAVASFVGTVRNVSEGSEVTGMELESATDLAVSDLNRIVNEGSARFGVSSISVVHRVGKLKVGDIIVMIAVSAPHRSEAFGACEFIIDELKKSTPIWKKEFSGTRGHWVKGEH